MATITEILKDAEDDIRTIMKHKDLQYLRMFLSAALMPQYKLKLPEGVPPYNPNTMEEGQVSPGVFWQFCSKLPMYVTGANDKRSQARIELNFIQVLETVSAHEALIILACKDQNLQSLYKGITLEALYKVGYYERPS